MRPFRRVPVASRLMPSAAVGSAAVVWDDALLAYDLGGQHPLDPVRLDLTMRLARALGVLDLSLIHI